MQPKSTQPSLCWSSRWPAVAEIQCIGPSGGCLCDWCHFPRNRTSALAPATARGYVCMMAGPANCAGEPGFGFQPQTSQGNLLTAELPTNCSLWGPHQPSPPSTPPARLRWAPLYILGFKGSFQVVFSWLFWVTFLYFSCNSNFFLGDGQCSFHSMHCPFSSFLVSIFVGTRSTFIDKSSESSL
uniref:Uncharacterized protein n=1 Tax=Molossus molossus TaxID=27622 RepID=A0A7J8GL20_MOLMO|nr:hypothetical protein HJG59_011540 [Molossus molossus]